MSAPDDDHPGVDHHDPGDDDHHPKTVDDDQVAGSAAPARSETTVLRTVQTLGAVIGPSALITALLYYFGWAKTEAFSQSFGLDVSLFSLTTQDYVLQSIRAVFVPLAVVLIAGLLLLRGHEAVVRLLERHPHHPLWRRAAAVLAVAGTASFVAGIVTYRDRDPTDVELVLTPLLSTIGVALIGYAALLERRRRQVVRPSEPPGQGSPGLTVLLLSMLLAVGIVWEVANYADVKGRQEARYIQDQLPYQPSVVVYSTKRLQVGAPGVTEQAFDPESAFPFRYDGLKLLFHSKGTLFLVPASWSTKKDSATVVLREDATLRFEFVRPAD